MSGWQLRPDLQVLETTAVVSATGREPAAFECGDEALGAADVLAVAGGPVGPALEETCAGGEIFGAFTAILDPGCDGILGFEVGCGGVGDDTGRIEAALPPDRAAFDHPSE